MNLTTKHNTCSSAHGTNGSARGCDGVAVDGGNSHRRADVGKRRDHPHATTLTYISPREQDE